MISVAQNVLHVTRAIIWNVGMKMADALKWAVGLAQKKVELLIFSVTFLRGFHLLHLKT
jgi:hypothetical protein